MNKQHGLLFKMLCICLATVLMAGSMVTVSFADECPNGGDHVYQWTYDASSKMHTATCAKCNTVLETVADHQEGNRPVYNNEKHWYVCILCGAQFDEETHQFGNWEDNGTGSHSRKCTVCDRRETAKHDNWTYKTTRNASGGLVEWHESNCTICGGKYKCYNPFREYVSLDREKLEAKKIASEDIVEAGSAYANGSGYSFGGDVYNTVLSWNSQLHYCCKCTNSRCSCSGVLAKHDWVDTEFKPRTLFTRGMKGKECWQCGFKTAGTKVNDDGSVSIQEKDEIPSVIEDIGAWIAGVFGFAGRVVIEPINWLVKLFTGSGIDDLKKD